MSQKILNFIKFYLPDITSMQASCGERFPLLSLYCSNNCNRNQNRNDQVGVHASKASPHPKIP